MLFPYRARAKIRVDALVRNFHAVRAVAEGAALCCVIKADAYGHGAVALARLYQSLGADRLAVATAEEALTLRRAAVRLPLLVLGPIPPEAATELAAQGVAVCLHSAEQAAGLSDALRGARRRLGA